jgi:glutaredoxin 3
MMNLFKVLVFGLIPSTNNDVLLPNYDIMSEAVILEHAKSAGTDFLMYTGNFCGYCTAAERLLTGKNLTHTKYNLDEHSGLRQQVVQATGHRTVPVIFDIRGGEVKYIGGFDETSKYLRN